MAKMFGMEQSWYAYKDEDGVYVYSLADFTVVDGVRGDTADTMEKYRRGALGALLDLDLKSSY